MLGVDVRYDFENLDGSLCEMGSMGSSGGGLGGGGLSCYPAVLNFAYDVLNWYVFFIIVVRTEE